MGLYRRLDQISASIERVMRDNNPEKLNTLCMEMNQVQAEVMAGDSDLLELFEQRQEVHRSGELLELLALMERIQERNGRVLPQALGILAVHRHELQRIKQGNTALQGYRPATSHSGRHISSTN